jgi:hypothetical protein
VKAQRNNLNEAILKDFIIPSIRQGLKADPDKLPILYTHLTKFVNTQFDSELHGEELHSKICEIIFESIQDWRGDTAALLKCCVDGITKYGTVDDVFRLCHCWMKTDPRPDIDLTELCNKIGYGRPVHLIFEKCEMTKRPLLYRYSNIASQPICMWRGYLFVATGVSIAKIGTGFNGTVAGVCIDVINDALGRDICSIGFVGNKLLYSNRCDHVLTFSDSEFQVLGSCEDARCLTFTTFQKLLYALANDSLVMNFTFTFSLLERADAN